MTIQEFNNVFGYLNPKFKSNVPSDFIVTNDDIITGKLVQKYVSSSNLTNIVNGFSVINDEICYMYTNINKITIVSDDNFPPCGGRIDVSVYAVYDIHKVDSNGVDTIYEENKSSKVNALISVDNDEFSYIKPELIKDTPNNTEENIEVNVSAVYYYKAVKYTCTKKIAQMINSISSWLIESETTLGINLMVTPCEIDNKGGIVIAKVEREFSRLYYKKDSCGNKVAEKNEPGHFDDITDKCIITSSNKKMFSINNNIISVSKQDVEAPKRSGIITARYFGGFESTAVVDQAEGGKISYEYDLTFDDGTGIKFVDLETSLKKKIIIPLISNENKYIDNIFDSSTITKELDIISDSEWLVASIDKTDNDAKLIVCAIEENLDKENDREGTITITNQKDGSLTIKLIVSQSSLDVVNETYSCDFYGEGTYTSDEIDTADFYFKVFKKLEYENGSIEVSEYDKLTPFDVYYESSNDKLLSLNKIIYNNGKYSVILNNLSRNSITDINASIKLSFKSLEAESKLCNIVVKGNTIYDYNYELCFDKHNKFENLKWYNNKESKVINITSLKHILKNGILVKSENTPFKISVFDETGKEYFDDSFSIKIDEDKLIIFPYNVSKQISKTYVIKQIETGLSIELKLDYLNSNNEKSIPLKVILYSKTIGSNLWTGEGGYMVVDDKTQIKLNPCWLSPTMTDNFDVAYDGNIDLKEGLHTFETFNVLCINDEAKTHKEIKLKEQILISKATKNILLTMIV